MKRTKFPIKYYYKITGFKPTLIIPLSLKTNEIIGFIFTNYL